LNSIAAVFTQNILPILIVAAFGYALQRWSPLDKRALSSVVLNLFSPCLVFASLVNNRLPGGELVSLTAFALLTMTFMGAIGLGAARLFRFSRLDTVALILVIMFVNGGNYGLTINQLRYGSDGLARAIVYYTASTFAVYTVGVLIASMGQSSWREAIMRLFRLPAVYAAVAAIAVYSWNIPVPQPLMRGIELAGAGAVPVMLVVLGMQLADLQGRAAFRLALPAVSMRLLIGPLVGVLVAALLGLQGLGKSTSIVEASMPTAVITTVLATEFDLQPTAVTSIVILSTLLSPLTVAATITMLGL